MKKALLILAVCLLTISICNAEDDKPNQKQESLTLSAEKALCAGKSVRIEKLGDRTNIGFWNDPKEDLHWLLYVPIPGKYKCYGEFAAAAGPAALSLSVVGQKNQNVNFDAPKTEEWNTPVIKEGDGIFNFKKSGVYRFLLKPKDPAAWKPVNLWSIKLVPSGKLAGTLYAGSKNVADGPFEPNVESLKQNYKFPEWFRDAKFGIYTHWGPVTHAIQHKDEANTGRFGWYGRQIYDPNSGGYAYHKKYWGGTEKTGYKDICAKFKAKDFDAEKWADIFEMAGAKFAGPVSTHHDNFLMWDSDINPYNAKNMGPKRDICGEVAKAVRKRGMKFIGTFHHGFSFRYYENAWKYDGKDAPELYGPERQALPKMVKDNNGKSINNPKWKDIPREWQEYWRNSVDEFVTKYQPDLIWFDFGLGWQNDDIRYQMYANYYNKAIAWGQPHPTVACKARSGDTVFHGTMDLERGMMPGLTAYPWLSDTSASAWFYYPNPAMQPNDQVVDMYVDIVSKNGCLLLNIGPDYKGNIPEEFMQGLRALGAFNKVCGEGIYNTRPWFTYGEGSAATSTGHHGAANSKAHKGSNFGPKDIRYTQSKDGKTLYAFAMDWPENGKLTLKSVHADKDGKVELLGHGPVKHTVNKDKTITIMLPEKAPVEHCNGLKLTGFKLSWQPLGHYELASASRLDPMSGTKDGDVILYKFQGGKLKKGKALLITSVDAEGKIEVYNEKNKKIGETTYKTKAGKPVEVGSFNTYGGPKATKLPQSLRITGIKAKQIKRLALGQARDETIIQLNKGF